MKITYVERHHIRKEARQIIDLANVILEEYAAAGQQMTLRQLFYQFVHRNWIANHPLEYKRMGEIIDNGRLAGLIDWDHVVDRTRFLRATSTHEGIGGAIRAVGGGYHEDKWADQDYHIEVWIEKDALTGSFEEICFDLQLGLFSCRGYSSSSEMWRASQRLIAHEQNGKQIVILHFSDHDPSGLDMTEDIRKRLERFECDVDVRRVALTIQQVREMGIPPNPAKLKDPRAEEYMKTYGAESWELDAIQTVPVNHFSEMVKEHVLSLRDEEKWKAAVKREIQARSILQQAAVEWDNLADHLKHGRKRRKKLEKLLQMVPKLPPGQRRSEFARNVSTVIEDTKGLI